MHNPFRRPPAAVPAQTFERVAVPNGTPVCRHCGGVHSYKCPRIRSIRYTTEAPEQVESVEYDIEISRQLWPGVVWPLVVEEETKN